MNDLGGLMSTPFPFVSIGVILGFGMMGLIGGSSSLCPSSSFGSFGGVLGKPPVLFVWLLVCLTSAMLVSD